MKEKTTDHSNKRILARGCDPVASSSFSKIVPPLIGHAEYVPTTNDIEFFEKLKSQEWSVIYFAPGACRFSAMKQQIPGGNPETKNWTLEEYFEQIQKLQGQNIQIVDSIYEHEAIELLNNALEKARTVKK